MSQLYIKALSQVISPPKAEDKSRTANDFFDWLAVYHHQQCASLIVHCPLPVALDYLVAEYAEPTITDVLDNKRLIRSAL